jgi:hypothetical protein
MPRNPIQNDQYLPFLPISQFHETKRFLFFLPVVGMDGNLVEVQPPATMFKRRIGLFLKSRPKIACRGILDAGNQYDIVFKAYDGFEKRRQSRIILWGLENIGMFIMMNLLNKSVQQNNIGNLFIGSFEL